MNHALVTVTLRPIEHMFEINNSNCYCCNVSESFNEVYYFGS